MNTNLSTSYAAIQIDRTRLSAQAELGWEAERASARTRRSAATVTRQWAGSVLVLAGERLRGTSHGVPAQVS